MAGLELFEKQGYASTSVQSVADAAGLTKGGFYHHFDSKGEMLRAIHDDFIGDQLNRARAVMAKADITTETRLRMLIEDVLLATMSQYKAEIAVYLQERRFLPEDLFKDIQKKRDEFERYFVQVIEDGVAEGVFRDLGPARVIAFGIIGMSSWTYTWFDLSGKLTAKQIGAMYSEMISGGLIQNR